MKVLLTGSTGYIGRRLLHRLLGDEGLSLRLFVRNKDKLSIQLPERVEVYEGDTFHEKSLHEALEGIDVAYYLIHSMGSKGSFRNLDVISAENFREACIANGVKRIVYLGGLGDPKNSSEHLVSRNETGEVLGAKPEETGVTSFRAGVIIGSGSASYEIIRNLVQKLPVMTAPKWVLNDTEPIGIDDVLTYLDRARFLNIEGNLTVDIGSGVHTFKELLELAAKEMGLNRKVIPVPVLSPKLASYWLTFFTPVPVSVARALVEGLRYETVKMNDNAARYFPEIVPASYEECVRKAIREIEHRQVVSRWCDSTMGEVCDVVKDEDMEHSVFVDRKKLPIGDVPPYKVFHAVISIGGDTGWYGYDFLWRIRGFIDKVFGGVGLNRGRRERDELRVGDSVDFWKVEDLKPGVRLVLAAQMKLPGKAWLEFIVGEDYIYQNAYFYPKGLAGRLYWYSVLPFHGLIFKKMVSSILESARRL
ncbi:SDR family oxidoreductase [Limisalsivibrio acetivorans]|uniref:SDR family oxidoreductase n=1 Tax=Limisalsivibrio acetivorans TaxID=1304888 RepID=UPI0003B38255|nr:SDR family oxidoreductase [Limisalsivibrio acetivorans]